MDLRPLLTEVELSFAPAEGGTLVTLEHSSLERFGGDADAERLRGGWSTRLTDYARHADLQS